MRINTLQLQNYKSYKDDLQQITISSGLNFIVGPNGAGKTNIVRAIQLVGQCIQSESIPLGNLDPDINLELHVSLSPDELELIGTIIAKSLITDLLSIIAPLNINIIRNLVFKPIIDNLDNDQIKTLTKELADARLLNNDLDYFLNDQTKLFDKRKNLLNQVTEKNYHEYKTHMETVLTIDSYKFGLLNSELTIEHLIDILLQDTTHKSIGNIFKNVKFIINANLQNISINYYFDGFSKKGINLQDQFLEYEKTADTKQMDLSEALNLYMAENEREVNTNIINLALNYIINLNASCFFKIQPIN